MFLLGTNVVSEFRKVRSGLAHPAVAAWSRSVLPGRLVLPAITGLEPECDAPIATTALSHGMAVVIRHRADFEATGVTLMAP